MESNLYWNSLLYQSPCIRNSLNFVANSSINSYYWQSRHHAISISSNRACWKRSTSKLQGVPAQVEAEIPQDQIWLTLTLFFNKAFGFASFPSPAIPQKAIIKFSAARSSDKKGFAKYKKENKFLICGPSDRENFHISVNDFAKGIWRGFADANWFSRTQIETLFTSRRKTRSENIVGEMKVRTFLALRRSAGFDVVRGRRRTSKMMFFQRDENE